MYSPGLDVRVNSPVPSGWNVASAAFETSAASLEQCPTPDLPELAFAGRSNVGKSSLINALTGQRGLARTSKTPGRTQLLNFMRLTLRGPGGDLLLRLVDLPGYGFARAAKQTRASLDELLHSYLEQRAGLSGLVLLVDARRSIDDRDLEWLGAMSERGLPTLMVLTKVDKLGAAARGVVVTEVAKAVGARREDILLTSSHAKIGLRDAAGSPGLAGDIARLVGGDGV